MANLKETFQAAVAARIKGNKEHGWGNEDSLAVILALIADNAGCEIKELEDDKAFSGAIRSVINPSAFRQKLESKGALNKSKSTREKADDLLADFMK